MAVSLSFVITRFFIIFFCCHYILSSSELHAEGESKRKVAFDKNEQGKLNQRALLYNILEIEN